MDRSTRNLSISTLLVLAIFLALNHIARRSGLADWGLVLFFLLLALAIWFYDRVSRRGLDDSERAETVIEPLTYEHPVGSISIPDSIQVSGPDLTRSPSPEQEVPRATQSQPETKTEAVEMQSPPMPPRPRPDVDNANRGSEAATETQAAANLSSTPLSDAIERDKSEAPPPAPAVDQHPPATAAETTTIEEKSAPPSSAPAPETHPDLAAKAPNGANLQSVPVSDKPASDPVPTPVSGTAPEPVAPRSSTEPVPTITPKEVSQNLSPSTPTASAPSQAEVSATTAAKAMPPASEAVPAAAPNTKSTPTVSGDVEVSATAAANATPAAPDPNLPKNAAPDKPDDLKIIEGIGPKMEKALQAAGISTFAMLAGASEAQIRAAIVAAGMRFAPTVPTWAEQASYAANGDFVGLEAFQKTLIGGRKAK